VHARPRNKVKLFPINICRYWAVERRNKSSRWWEHLF